MNKLPTAKEFISSFRTGKSTETPQEYVCDLLNAFAKIHVEAAKDTNWTILADHKPTEKDGKKVLIYRISNEQQELMAMTIFDTALIHLCDKNETWWMPLPQPPKMNP